MVEGIGGRSFPLRMPQELPDPTRMPPASSSSRSPLAAPAGPSAPSLAPEKAAGAGEPGFGSSMGRFLGEVNDLHLRSDTLFQSFVRGETADLHQVVLAQQEAAIAMRLVTEMRDRLLQSYQEVMRMTV